MKAQTLLEQAEGCVDAALDAVLRTKGELMEAGVSAFTIGIINGKLCDAVGEMHKVRRLLPGYRRSTYAPREEDD